MEDFFTEEAKLKYESGEPDMYESGKALRICEDSLTRTLKAIENSSFAIFTAYRKKFTRKENILRNRKLRAILNGYKLGVHQLVGHYSEMQDDGNTEQVTERSYLVEKPDRMSDSDFCDIVVKCLTIDGEIQDCALCKFKSKPDKGFALVYPDYMIKTIGHKLKIGEIGKLYSQHVKKLDMPFKFEGEFAPEGSIASCVGYKSRGYTWS